MIQHTPPTEAYAKLPASERAAMVGIYAGLLATLHVIEEEIARDPKGVEAVLLATWEEVEKAFLKEANSLQAAAAVKFMHEYFHHAGDWRAIRQCVTVFAEALQTEPHQLSRLMDQGVLKFRAIYRRRFGSAR